MVDLRPEEREQTLSILQRYVPNQTVFAFGSRTTDRVKPFSDLDLVIFTKKPLALGLLADLREAFSESSLPFKVDLVDWAATDDSFKKIIRPKLVEFYQAGMLDK